MLIYMLSTYGSYTAKTTYTVDDTTGFGLIQKGVAQRAESPYFNAPTSSPTGGSVQEFIALGPSYGQIMDAVNKGIASGKTFEVVLPTGAIDLSSAGIGLPVGSGYGYRGIGMNLDMSNATIPDASTVKSSTGTVLTGNGTFAAFQFNKSALGAPASAAAFTAQGAKGFTLRTLGFSNFTSAIASGNTNAASFWNSEFDTLWADSCTSWAFDISNFSHCKMRRMFSYGNVGGHRYGVSVDNGTFIPTNSVMEDIYSVIPNNSTNWLNQGILLDVTNNGIHNQLYAYRFQSNRFNQNSHTYTCSTTNSNASISSADATTLVNGLPVSPTSTAAGFVQNQIYFLVNVAGSPGAWTFGLANSKGGSAINATAGGTNNLSLITYGFAAVEFTADSTSKHLNAEIYGVDVEGGGTSPLILQNFNASKISVSEFPQSNQMVTSFVMRGSPYSKVMTQDVSTTWDADSGSSSSELNTPAPITNARQCMMVGRMGATTVQNGAALSATPARYKDTFINPDGLIGFTKPGIAIGQRVAPKDSSETVNTFECGVVPCKVASQTFTIPTISANWVGLEWEFVNASSGTMTVATDGTQVFNGQAGKVTTTVAAGLTVHCRAIQYADSSFGVQAYVGGALP